jgi:hypothetical protein
LRIGGLLCVRVWHRCAREDGKKEEKAAKHHRVRQVASGSRARLW